MEPDKPQKDDHMEGDGEEPENMDAGEVAGGAVNMDDDEMPDFVDIDDPGFDIVGECGGEGETYSDSEDDDDDDDDDAPEGSAAGDMEDGDYKDDAVAVFTGMPRVSFFLPLGYCGVQVWKVCKVLFATLE